MTAFDAIVLGIVEGITEFLPISSTGHLILVSDLLKLPETDFLKTFQVAIQLGAILAVVALYWRQLCFDRTLDRKILVALLPALVVGLFFFGTIKRLFESSLTVVVALFLGGLILILFELWRKRTGERGGTLAELSYPMAFLIGVFQAIAVIPGVSRAGATILGGLVLGLERKAIVEFSFLLAIPTMLAATALDIWKHGAQWSLSDVELLLIGLVVSFCVALAAVKLLLRYIETNTFIAFGVYRILLAVLFFLLVL